MFPPPLYKDHITEFNYILQQQYIIIYEYLMFTTRLNFGLYRNHLKFFHHNKKEIITYVCNVLKVFSTYYLFQNLLDVFKINIIRSYNLANTYQPENYFQKVFGSYDF
eukprot:EC094709.1.p2 GENE.EC094709.1~~EC094709.1.p2  ORF type:complete len:108 (-),score=10.50 EC094709.1:1-324(-)